MAGIDNITYIQREIYAAEQPLGRALPNPVLVLFAIQLATLNPGPSSLPAQKPNLL